MKAAAYWLYCQRAEMELLQDVSVRKPQTTWLNVRFYNVSGERLKCASYICSSSQFVIYFCLTFLENVTAIVKGTVNVSKKNNLDFLHVDMLHVDIDVKNVGMAVRDVYRNNRILG